jgi:hypothetical protein
VFSGILSAQGVWKDTSWIVTQAVDSGTIYFAGTEDPENTRYIGDNYQRTYGVESMRYLRITNLDSLPSHGAKFLLNRRGNWYSRQEMAEEALRGAVTEKEKSLSLFEFVRKNREQYYNGNHHSDSDSFSSLFKHKGFLAISIITAIIYIFIVFLMISYK